MTGSIIEISPRSSVCISVRHRKRRNCFEPRERERDRSVTHQYGVVRCPIRCQPSGSPFEGYEAGSGLSFLWLAFREDHFPSRPFVSSLIPASFSLLFSLYLLFLPSQLRLPQPAYSFFSYTFNLPALSSQTRNNAFLLLIAARLFVCRKLQAWSSIDSTLPESRHLGSKLIIIPSEVEHITDF